MRIVHLSVWLLMLVAASSCVLGSSAPTIESLDTYAIVPPQQEVLKENNEEEREQAQSNEEKLPGVESILYTRPVFAVVRSELADEETNTTVIEDTTGTQHSITGMCGETLMTTPATTWYHYETPYFSVDIPYHNGWGTEVFAYPAVQEITNDYGRFWYMGAPTSIECSWTRELFIGQYAPISREMKEMELRATSDEYTTEQTTVSGYPALRYSSKVIEDNETIWIFTPQYVYEIGSVPFTGAPLEEFVASVRFDD